MEGDGSAVADSPPDLALHAGKDMRGQGLHLEYWDLCLGSTLSLGTCHWATSVPDPAAKDSLPRALNKLFFLFTEQVFSREVCPLLKHVRVVLSLCCNIYYINCHEKAVKETLYEENPASHTRINRTQQS